MPVVAIDASVQSQVNRSSDVTAKKAGDLAAATAHLFTNDINPGPSTVLGDFVEAAFTGYAAVAVAGWTANRLNTDGSVSIDATNVMPFVGPNDATGETIRGYFVRSAGAGTPYLYAVRFPVPVALLSPADVLALVVTYRNP